MSHNTTIDYDIVIVGGGMLGATLALALEQCIGKNNLKVAVIEAVDPESQKQPSFDDRSVALSYISTEILTALDLWGDLAKYAEPIKHIHVSDRGHLGMAEINAEQLSVDALGQVIENRSIGKVLQQRLQDSGVEYIAPATVIDYKQTTNFAELIVDVGQQKRRHIFSHLVVAADGTFSTIRELLGIDFKQKPYEQYALIANIRVSHARSGWAFERFTKTGPVALLPLTQQRYSLVWSIAPEQQAEFQALSDDQLIGRLQEYFGYRAGRITKIGRRSIYPLAQRKMKRADYKRTIFIGNALHTAHPVAGQGFNLGLRDVAQLVEIIAAACKTSSDLSQLAIIQVIGKTFDQLRRADIQQTMYVTDGLARLFSNQNSILSLVRGKALSALGLLNSAKQAFAKQAMGVRDDLPALARRVKPDDLYQQPIAREIEVQLSTHNTVENTDQGEATHG